MQPVRCSRFHPIAGALSALALVVPFSPDRVVRYWTQVKLVYGVTWLFVCGWVFFAGQSAGLVWKTVSVALSSFQSPSSTRAAGTSAVPPTGGGVKGKNLFLAQ